MLSETVKLYWCKTLKKNWIHHCNQFWVSNWWKKDSNGYLDWVTRTSHTIAISSFTWLQSYQTLITFPKSVSRQQSSTSQSLQRVLKTNCWHKSWDFRESNCKQRESSWSCRYQQTRNNFNNYKTRYYVRSATHRVEFSKTSNWLTHWMQPRWHHRQ